MAYRIINQDVLQTELRPESVQCIVTSPPYWGMRKYTGEAMHWPRIEYSPVSGVDTMVVPESDCALGQESRPSEYVSHLIHVFRHLRPALHSEGTVWVNLGDTYLRKSIEGLPKKSLAGIPWRFALAMQADGWYLRNDVIWHKTRIAPNGPKDRCVVDHEYLFLFAKGDNYYFDIDAIREPSQSNKVDRRRMRTGQKRVLDSENKEEKSISRSGSKLGQQYSVGDPSRGRQKRSVWPVCTSNFRGKHFATFPESLITPCILASTPESVCSSCGKASCECCGQRQAPLVLDPFCGAATTLLVATKLNRDSLGLEISSDYVQIAEDRLRSSAP